MEKERMIEELALIEGFTFTEKMEHNTYPYGWTVRAKTWFDRLNNNVHCSDLPDYLNNHNACQRIIDGFHTELADSYFEMLEGLVSKETLCSAMKVNEAIVKATCEQKCEAILKAYGKYDEECE